MDGGNLTAAAVILKMSADFIGAIKLLLLLLLLLHYYTSATTSVSYLTLVLHFRCYFRSSRHYYVSLCKALKEELIL